MIEPRKEAQTMSDEPRQFAIGWMRGTFYALLILAYSFLLWAIIKGDERWFWAIAGCLVCAPFVWQMKKSLERE